MKALIIIFMLLGASSFAEETASQDDFFIRPLDSNIDTSKLAAKNVTILPAYDTNSFKSNLPSVKLRDKVFSESNLSGQLKDWDDFDLDSLYIKLERGGETAISSILKKYPTLDQHALERAQNAIAGMKK